MRIIKNLTIFFLMYYTLYGARNGFTLDNIYPQIGQRGTQVTVHVLTKAVNEIHSVTFYKKGISFLRPLINCALLLQTSKSMIMRF